MTPSPKPDAVRLRITLQQIEPAPWRVVDVPLGLTLGFLHDVIQAAFGWEDCHLWEFLLGRKRAGMPDREDPELTDAGRLPLSRCLAPRTKEMIYIYDFGDDWVHRIQIERRFRAEDLLLLPEFVEGGWAAPPEDSGGPWGFATLKEAIADPGHEDHEHFLEWHGPFDPSDIREAETRARIARIRNYLNGAARKACRPGRKSG